MHHVRKIKPHDIYNGFQSAGQYQRKPLGTRHLFRPHTASYGKKKKEKRKIMFLLYLLASYEADGEILNLEKETEKQVLVQH